MLARSGQLPSRREWSYEVKWDGFRAIVSTEGETLRVRSRRGWNMLAPSSIGLQAGSHWFDPGTAHYEEKELAAVVGSAVA